MKAKKVRKYACDKCQVSYNQSNNLWHHKKTEGYQNGEKFNCNLCQFLSCTKFMLHKHFKMEHSRKGKKLKIKSEPNLAHDATKSHPCDKCDAKYVLKGTLRTHQQSSEYQNDQKSTCEQCPFVSCTQKMLEIHTRKKHGGLEYQCDKCSVTYSRKHMLDSHKNGASYQNDQKNPCQHCEFVSCSKVSLAKHEKDKHGRNDEENESLEEPSNG